MANARTEKNAKKAVKLIKEQQDKRLKRLAKLETNGLNTLDQLQRALTMMTADINTIYNTGNPKLVIWSENVYATFTKKVEELEQRLEAALAQVELDNSSATKIQKMVRSHNVSKAQAQVELENSSATKIQSVFRGHNVRSSLKSASEKYTILSERADNAGATVVAALYKEAARLHLKAETAGGISGYLWGSSYLAKALAVDSAIKAMENVSKDSIESSMKDHDSGLYNALNTHSSYIFKFSTGSYGVPASPASRAILNINNIIDKENKVEEVTLSEAPQAS